MKKYRLQVYELLKAGCTKAEAARQIGITKVYVGYIAKELIADGFISAGGEFIPLEDLPQMETRTKGEITKDNVLRLALEGKTTKQISKALNKDRSRVDQLLRILRKEGLIN